MFRAKPEGEIKFFGFNAWKSILGLEGKLLLLFYGGPGFPRVACVSVYLAGLGHEDAI